MIPNHKIKLLFKITAKSYIKIMRLFYFKYYNFYDLDIDLFPEDGRIDDRNVEK